MINSLNKKHKPLEFDRKKEPKFEESVTERTKLEKQKSDEQSDATYTLDLESEESAVQRKNQSGIGLKVLTPSQILSRLTISLAHLKAGNNSEKLKNETRQQTFFVLPVKNEEEITKKLRAWVEIMTTQLVIYWILLISEKIADYLQLI